MIKPDTAYVIPFETTAAGLPVAADEMPNAVLWRNGSAEDNAVVIITTANTGIYHASFTTDEDWLPTDRLWLVVSATIGGDAYTGIAWDSFGESDNAADIATAVVEKVVSNSNPVGSVGYWLSALGSMIEFVGGLWRLRGTSLSQSPQPDLSNVATTQDVTDAKDEVIESVPTSLEREDGPLYKLFRKFDGIDKLVKWIRQ